MLKINNKDEGYITFLFAYILFTCNAYFRMNFLAKKITIKVPFNFILQAIYLLCLFSKLFTCIILLTNNESLNFPSKELTTKNPSDPILNSRAVGRSENPRGQSPPGWDRVNWSASLVWTAERSRAGVWVWCSSPVVLRLNPVAAVYVKECLSPSTIKITECYGL